MVKMVTSNVQSGSADVYSKKTETVKRIADQYVRSIRESGIPRVPTVAAQYKEMLAAVGEGGIHNYLSHIDSVVDGRLSTELFPEAALQAYTRHNLGEPPQTGDEQFFTAHRGGEQGDYREGIQEKITQVVSALQDENRGKSAFLVIPNNLAPAPQDDANAKCLQLMNFWIRDAGSGGRYLDTSVNFRAQAVEIFPKNIHFIRALIEKVCEEINNSPANSGQYSEVIPGKMHYQAAFLTNARVETQTGPYQSSMANIPYFDHVTEVVAYLRESTNLPSMEPVVVGYTVSNGNTDRLLDSEPYQQIAPTEQAQDQLERSMNRVVEALSDRPLSKRAYLFLPSMFSSLKSSDSPETSENVSGGQLLQFQAVPASGDTGTSDTAELNRGWRLNVTVIARGESPEMAEQTLTEIQYLLGEMTEQISAERNEPFQPGSILYQSVPLSSEPLSESVLSQPEAIQKSIAAEVLPAEANIRSSEDIAIIDARPLLHYGETGERTSAWQESIQQLEHALREVGFLTFTHHGLDASEAKSISRAYFSQPEAYKRELILTKECQFGFSIDERLYQTEESYDGNGKQKLGDPKQSFNMPPPESALSRWPDGREGFDAERFQQVLTRYFRDCEAFTEKLLPNLAYILKVEPDYFKARMDDHMSVVRSLFYPAAEAIEELEADGMRASSHSDFGLLTLLQTFGTPGLQVLNREGDWITVQTGKPDDLVVNIGDALSRMTNGTFRSTRHRVAHLISDERQSIPYFVNFASEALVEVVPAFRKSVGNLPPVSSGDYIMAKNARAHGLY